MSPQEAIHLGQLWIKLQSLCDITDASESITDILLSTDASPLIRSHEPAVSSVATASIIHVTRVDAHARTHTIA